MCVSVSVSVSVCVCSLCECFCLQTLQLLPYLVNKALSGLGTEQQDGPSQSVPVTVQLLHTHGAEESGEDLTNVTVHHLQGHVQAQPRCLVQKRLQSTDVCRENQR